MQLGSSIRRRRTSGQARGKKGRDAIRLAALSVAVLGLGFGGGWLVSTRALFPAPPPPDDLHEVPDLRGGGLERAVELLAAAGLSLGTVDELRSPAADSGAILGQGPLPGQLGASGAPVRVTVSLGPERRPVPDVLRLQAEWARSVVEATGFAVVLDSVESELPAGRVWEVVPPAGTDVALPGEVRIVVSLGPPTFPMPLLLGMTEEEARDSLDALGLVVGQVEEIFRFGFDRGRVVEQVPPADSLVLRGSSVRLSVGRRGNKDLP